MGDARHARHLQRRIRTEGDGSADQIFPEAYDKIHAQTMTPVAHLCWSSAWAGIAAAAVERAQAFIRKAARGAGGQMPPGAAHFTAARMTLAKLRAMITSNLDTYARPTSMTSARCLRSTSSRRSTCSRWKLPNWRSPPS
jgi:hypothetical protein